MAAADAAAKSTGKEIHQRIHEVWRDLASGDPGVPIEPLLPMPMVNLISGGLHAGRKLDFQDFLMIPIGATSIRAALEMSLDVYRSLGVVLRDAGDEGVLVGDEGGFGPRLVSNEQALERCLVAVERAGLRPGIDVAFALDVAASHFLDTDTGCYRLNSEGGSLLEPEEMVDRLADWVDRYPIVSIEDGLAEDDWSGWRILTDRLGDRVQLVGDDLFVTRSDRIARGAREGTANAALIKLNQVGTLTETLQAVLEARRCGFRTVISARSGETEDTFLADLAVGCCGGQIKVGSVARSERLAKYNRLLRIAEHLPGAFAVGLF
jgi:enolase